MADKIQLIEEQKAEIVKLANATASEMISAYKKIYLEIEKQIDLIAQAMKEAIDKGETLDASWLQRQESLQVLRNAVIEEIANYALEGVSKVNTKLAEAVEEGADDFEAQLRRFEIDIRFNTLPRERLDRVLSVMKVQRDRIADLPESTFQRILDEFIKGVGLGYNPRKIAANAKETTALPLNRLLNISRTEILRSYREVHYETRQENTDILSGWVWYCALKSNTCAICWSRHGKVFALEQRLNDHNNGACTAVAQVRGFEDEITSGADGFKELSEEQKLKVLGPTRLALYKSGRSLDSFIQEGLDPRWGKTYHLKPLKP